MPPIIFNLWNPHPKQKLVLDDKSRFKVLRCGRRFGKTTLALNYMVKKALTKKKGLYYYVAPTYEQGKDIAWVMLDTIYTSLPLGLKKKRNEAELYIEIGNGSRIAIKGADKPDRLRGVGLDGAVLDEYATMKPFVWEEIIRPALLDKQGWAIFMGTPKGFNHFYKLYTEAENRTDWAAFHFTSYDNPVNTEAELEGIKRDTSPEKFEQEYMAEFRRMEGIVYKDFNHDTHIFDKVPEHNYAECIAGVDFGTTKPAAVVVIKRDKDDNYYVVDELYKTGLTNEELIEECKVLKGLWGINAFYPDSAEPDRIMAMQKAGLYCRPVSKEVLVGIDRVQNLFRSNKLFLSYKCYNLIFELDSYAWKMDKRGTTFDAPIKENDHAADALRYALYSNAPIIESDEDYRPQAPKSYDPYA